MKTKIFPEQVSVNLLLFSFLLIAASACCPPKVLVDTTKETSVNAGIMNKKLTDYSKRFEEIAAEEINRTIDEKAKWAELENELNEKYAIVKLTADKKSLALYNGVLDTAKESLAARKELSELINKEKASLKETQKRFNNYTKELSSLASLLNDLVKPPTWKEKFTYLYNYAKKTGKNLNEIDKKIDEEQKILSKSD
jgi:hypothetical protein